MTERVWSVDILVPPLFKLVRTQEIPTILRTSALSLLAECINTYSLAVLPYIEDLAGAMIDLLQIESTPIQQQSREAKDKQATPDTQHRDNENNEEKKAGESSPKGTKASEVTEEETAKSPLTMDEAPTSNNSKFPPLRRAALHLLGLLIKEATRHVYESTSPGSVFLPQQLVSKATATLGYIASTDEDGVVRVMAREVREQLSDLQRAKLGL